MIKALTNLDFDNIISLITDARNRVYVKANAELIKRPHENPSIGILLCKGKDVEVVEYALARNLSPALIADYKTKLIDKKLLAKKLNQLSETFYSNEE